MHSHIASQITLGVLILSLIVIGVCAFMPKIRKKAFKIIGITIGGTLCLFLVGRGIAEFWTVDYGNPASYRDNWGGPSLLGVFIVHSGPAVVILAGGIFWLVRKWRSRR